MKLLTFTTLYPSAARPGHALSVETRLRRLVDTGEAESRVVAPVPWFPSAHPSFGAYSAFARTPKVEEREGLRVIHPRYPVIPKIGMSAAPFLLASAVRPVLLRMLEEYSFDGIDAHYFYPDGVAAVMLGRYFGKPVVITAGGADLNVIPRYRVPRRMIQWAAARAAGIVALHASLKERLVDLGVPADRVTVLPNGVDLDRFRPVERDTVRARLKLAGITLLSVGSLIPLKGHDIVIRALSMLPDCALLIAGEGPEQVGLAQLARDIGVADRVTFAGVLSENDLREYYGAADVLILAATRGDWANAALESLACGTPVIATNIGGISEVITSPVAGLLIDRRTPEDVAEAVRRLLERCPERSGTRRYAEQFSWKATTEGQLELFSRVLSMPRHSPTVRVVATSDRASSRATGNVL